ncbi:hypothetical protein LWI28_008278 [Acer negundo]|uniref:Late embryogenesis abundant protein LEA-2 subgroup domain-containing protein n=1 Tax=Acer negundo TaxID=4023 RepID=A0AAD5P5P1_ACENE|nr:hypothetical protein LWI28_008278 [Acer negundo]
MAITETEEDKRARKCCSFIVFVIVVTPLFVVYVRYGQSIQRPNIYVNSASVNPFAISNSTSPVTAKWNVTFITAVWNFTFDIDNPNKNKIFMYFNGFDFNVTYGEDVLSSGSIEPFELERKESNLINKTINTLPATISEQAAKRMEDELSRSNVVNFHITIKGVVSLDTEVPFMANNLIIKTHCENLKMLFSSDRRAGKMLGPSKCQVKWYRYAGMDDRRHKEYMLGFYYL